MELQDSKKHDSSSQTDNISNTSNHDSTKPNATLREIPSILSTGISSWAQALRGLQGSHQGDSQSGNEGKSTLQRITSGFGSLLPSNLSSKEESVENNTTVMQSGVFEVLTKGLVDSSRTAMKTVQVKARQIASQNKKRYQEGEFDLDLTYITEKIIAMGFPSGYISSGFLGLFEFIIGFYRNHMEEVIKFLETHHKGKYKVYNLCSERLYDASLFEGKVACFPIDEHNCPSIQLIASFCESAKSWLEQDVHNVVIVHSKAGVARTGLMISSLLLYLKIFPAADESIDYFNKERCLDSKGLIIPSQIRYVRYFGYNLTYSNGDISPGRRCMLKGFRLHNCPYWIRPSIIVSQQNGVLFSTKKHPKTKDLMPEHFWFKSKQKGIMIFALPREPGLTELAGDFKIYFQDRQGDFYCWLNTSMIENRVTLNTTELDDFEKRKVASPGFQVEIVMVDYDSSKSQNQDNRKSDVSVATEKAKQDRSMKSRRKKDSNDDVFSDSDTEDSRSPNQVSPQPFSNNGENATFDRPTTNVPTEGTASIAITAEQISCNDEKVETRIVDGETKEGTSSRKLAEAATSNSTSVSEFKAIAADASVFSFGDDEDYESE
ncbi:phosphatidylinositol 3,4,5-trisphosphate 3-phosphatase and protein-tyrosine-phosphatase PTEN2A-like [Zingiber officinale]|uniref:phosphatidylinositol 3,4,5-trisphosphate 3-phosphatase and protein-tyrosine-phosphatase PTEN2A-like n=1 Tax=Zingiber officinale TaxID=94328 RepID=UPI001C4C32A1|nr:phosphatidylinositol 3,4,5-trisphosphate 3-phosphatase and protein-tyrosine-phosphatase PTEN2A-like [Zingiber officinale]